MLAHRRSPAAALALVLTFVVGLLVVGAPADAQSGETPGLADARRKANAAAAEMNELEAELGRLEGDIERSRAEAETAQRDHDLLADQVRALAVARYVQVGDGERLAAADINEQARAQALLAAVTGQDVDALDQFRSARAALDDSLASLADQEERQRSAVAALEAKRGELDAELARLERLEAQRLAEEQRRREEEARRAAEAAAREQAAREAAELAARQQAQAEGRRATATTPTTAAAGPSTTRPGGGTTPTTRPTTTVPAPPTAPPPPIASGSWVCPVQGARSFVDSWGFPRPGGRRHQGVDLMSPRGTPVVTPVAGSVQLRSNSVGGLSFHLMGNDGNYYYGTHMDAYADIPNGTYPAGTVVGYVGDTGDARGTGTHLHFEIHPGGRGGAINPYPTVARYC